MSKPSIDSFNSPLMIFFDWALAFASIAYGIYLISSDNNDIWSYLLVGCGLIACVFAYLRPANIVKNSLRNRLVKR